VTSAGAPFALDGLLRRAAEAEPDRLAVKAPDASLTYAELEQGAARTASALRELGVRPGDRVAIWAPKSSRALTAIYGTLRAGAAYVPIDPLTPDARAVSLLEDADCRVLCADGSRLERLLGAAPDGLRTVNLSAGSTATIGFDELQRLDADVSPCACESDLAYILYTSGSTGIPKGVMLSHRNALSFVEWAVDRFAVRAADRLSSHAPFHFDLSVFDIYASAMTAASLHVLAPGEEGMAADMAEAIRSRGLTVWYSVPSALVLLCDVATREDLDTLRTVLFAGEVFPVKYLRRLRELVPHATLANLYGPTETNVCTYFIVDRELPPGDDPIPIGRACENQAVFALDDDLRPVAEGEIGELWVRGPTVMKGYWGDPDETRKRLQQNPLHDLFPDPAYRTGDLVRRLPGGSHEFLGRRDHQVKSRGYRIELGDIESVLNGHRLVREVAVVAVPDERIGARLIGFVGADSEVDELDLRRHCANTLPRYMVPASIVVEASLPHTSTGKIDRRELGRRAAAG
jgi:amino acid adenylation domain-containing protein